MLTILDETKERTASCFRERERDQKNIFERERDFCQALETQICTTYTIHTLPVLRPTITRAKPKLVLISKAVLECWGVAVVPRLVT